MPRLSAVGILGLQAGEDVKHATGLVVMQIGFTVTSLAGIWKWLIVPHAALKSIHKNGG